MSSRDASFPPLALLKVDGLHDKASPYTPEETKRRILHLHGSLHVRTLLISLLLFSYDFWLDNRADRALFLPARSLQERTRRSQGRVSGGVNKGQDIAPSAPSMTRMKLTRFHYRLFVLVAAKSKLEILRRGSLRHRNATTDEPRWRCRPPRCFVRLVQSPDV